MVILGENHSEGAFFFLVKNVIILPSLLEDIFTGYTIVDYQVHFLWCFDMSFLCLLASVAPVEKATVCLVLLKVLRLWLL